MKPPASAEVCEVILMKVQRHTLVSLYSTHTQMRHAHFRLQRPVRPYCAHPAPTAEKYQGAVALPPSTPHIVQEFSSTPVPRKGHREPAVAPHISVSL